MPFTIEQLIDDRNRPLYDEIAAQMRLELREEPIPEEGWGSQYRANESLGIVFHAPTPYPQACFTHELLHIKYEAGLPVGRFMPCLLLRGPSPRKNSTGTGIG